MPVRLMNTKAEFDDALAGAGATLVVVDFTASWCGPCRMIGPYFEELSGEYGDKFVALKVDVDANAEVAEFYEISAMPTFLAFKGKEKIDQLVGASKDKLKELIDKNL